MPTTMWQVEETQKDEDNSIEGFDKYIHFDGDVLKSGWGGIVASTAEQKANNVNNVIGRRGTE